VFVAVGLLCPKKFSIRWNSTWWVSIPVSMLYFVAVAYEFVIISIYPFILLLVIVVSYY